MEKRVISTQVQDEDIKIEKNLRPQTLDDYIGQQKAKKNLKVYIEAAKQRGESFCADAQRFLFSMGRGALPPKPAPASNTVPCSWPDFG